MELQNEGVKKVEGKGKIAKGKVGKGKVVSDDSPVVSPSETVAESSAAQNDYMTPVELDGSSWRDPQ